MDIKHNVTTKYNPKLKHKPNKKPNLKKNKQPKEINITLVLVSSFLG